MGGGRAALGVAHEVATRAFAWPTLVVALGYPPYFVLRRRINADSLAAFAVEIVLLCPVAFAMVATSTTQVADHPVLWAAAAGPRRAQHARARELPEGEPDAADGAVRDSRLRRLLVAVSLLLLGETLSIASSRRTGRSGRRRAHRVAHAMLMRRLPARG